MFFVAQAFLIPSGSMNYTIAKKQPVLLSVYNILGRKVVTLVNEEQEAGKYEVKFDASSLSSGIYFYRLQAGKFASTKKMILLK
jgi:hypothetical protein